MAFCPFAIQDPGPAWKVNFGVNGGEGIICHSAEGDLEHTLARLHSTAEVSWHFTVAKDGRIYQHYDTQKQTWHARAANVRYIGAEHEGVASEPETDEQVGADIRLIAWLGEVYGWAKFSRTTNLREHNEFVATACPSQRIRWDDILEGLNMPEPIPDLEASYRLEIIRALAAKRYQARRVGLNPLGQAVFELLLPDGNKPDPPILIAV